MAINPNFNPFPLLETARLTLRALELEDAEIYFALRNNESVNTYLTGYQHANLEESRSFIEKINTGIANNQSIYWVMELKGKPGLIGSVCLWNLDKKHARAETGYMLHPDFQGQGYMKEAMDSVLTYAFEQMHLKSILAYTHKHNQASAGLLKKYGFVLMPGKSTEPGSEEIIFELTDTTFAGHH